MRPYKPELKNPSFAVLQQQNQDSNNYKVISELGKGAFGVVYKVQVASSTLPLVLKKINLTFMKPKQQQEALQEAQVLKKLSHPNIIKYYDSFIENNSFLCILMEFADGGDLNQLIKQMKNSGVQISEERALQIFLELASALQHLHDQQIIHRDIKTLNVFLTKKQEVKLGDLGVSKILNHEHQMAGTRVGTPLYLAPELVQQQKYDYKVQIY